MDRTREIGLRLNPDKCHIKVAKIKFFGNYLSERGLEPDPSKVAAIIGMTPPGNVTEVQSILGMANYLSRFTPNLAIITSPLRDLTKKDTEWTWGPEHKQAFNRLKDAISSTDVLAYYDPAKPATIQTDASKRGLGATVLQDCRPVAYASKSLTETESNYANIEREMLAVVFGLERFHHYAYGRPCGFRPD